jgi:hypothetical protein
MKKLPHAWLAHLSLAHSINGLIADMVVFGVLPALICQLFIISQKLVTALSLR